MKDKISRRDGDALTSHSTQNCFAESVWGQYFRNAELETIIDKDLMLRLYLDKMVSCRTVQGRKRCAKRQANTKLVRGCFNLCV
jgi:hypothetical protein